VLTIALTGYALAIESFGIGLFLQNDPAPKLHMRGEAYVIGSLSCYSALGLGIASILIGHWSIELRRMGYIAIAFWLFYLSIPRF
jgi:hypothetical protein